MFLSLGPYVTIRKKTTEALASQLVRLVTDGLPDFGTQDIRRLLVQMQSGRNVFGEYQVTAVCILVSFPGYFDIDEVLPILSPTVPR